MNLENKNMNKCMIIKKFNRVTKLKLLMSRAKINKKLRVIIIKILNEL